MPDRAAEEVPETPPLTRGRLRTITDWGKDRGNTPAYAGKTFLGPRRAPVSRKHPRLRGEDCASDEKPPITRETPPLTRGRPAARDDVKGVIGNTPAYAGKTMTKEEHAAAFEKHPRLRGEDSEINKTFRRDAETPPLTRGRLAPDARAKHRRGNTPAYAGKTHEVVC